MPRVVVDVDSQFDFVDPAGALYVPGPGVRDAIATILSEAQASGDTIVGSVDSHAWDAWEFADQGGPFASHCVKGQSGWLRVVAAVPSRTRFVPMQRLVDGGVANLVGEAVQGQGTRLQSADDLVAEARSGVGIYFEKEVYSLFSNPTAELFLAALVASLGGREAVEFDVIGYCTGGYCVDAAAIGLVQRGYSVRVIGAATAAIGGSEGAAQSRSTLEAQGVRWLDA